jgi:hypothetical protein
VSETFSRLLNAQFLIHFELLDQIERIRTLCHEKPILKGKFAERLLLYDHVVTPTVDFSIIPVLVTWLGEGLFRDVLARGALSFVRFRGGVGYSPGASGLGNFQIGPGQTQRRRETDRQFTAFTRNPADAIEIWLRDVIPELTPRNRVKISRSVLRRTKLLDEFPNFKETVEEETYQDVIGSPELRDYFGLQITNLAALRAVAENQFRVASPNTWMGSEHFDEADILLGMALVNLELSLVGIAEATDAAFDPSIERFMLAKEKRALSGDHLSDAFIRILEINDLPDVSHVVATRQISLKDTWKLREGASGEAFRRWFHEKVRAEPERAAQEYVTALSATSWVNSVPVKVLRLLITMPPLGLVSPILGLSDNLLGNSVQSRRPRYLIDDLKRKLPRRAGVREEVSSR